MKQKWKREERIGYTKWNWKQMSGSTNYNITRKWRKQSLLPIRVITTNFFLRMGKSQKSCKRKKYVSILGFGIERTLHKKKEKKHIYDDPMEKCKKIIKQQQKEDSMTVPETENKKRKEEKKKTEKIWPDTAIFPIKYSRFLKLALTWHQTKLFLNKYFSLVFENFSNIKIYIYFFLFFLNIKF